MNDEDDSQKDRPVCSVEEAFNRLNIRKTKLYDLLGLKDPDSREIESYFDGRRHVFVDSIAAYKMRRLRAEEAKLRGKAQTRLLAKASSSGRRVDVRVELTSVAAMATAGIITVQSSTQH